MELIFKNGNEDLAEHIPYVKENLGKIRLVRGGETVGSWVMFSPEGKALYNDNEIYDQSDVVVLCDASLVGIPWGAYFKVEYQGENRPVAICEDQFEEGHVFQYADWAITQILEGMFKDLQEGKYKIEEPGLKEYLVHVLKQAPENDVSAALKSLLEQ